MGLETTGNPTFCTIWTLCGMPSITLPVMQGENNMPLGLQLVGPRGDDARLLRTARWLVNEINTDRIVMASVLPRKTLSDIEKEK